ncbi:hypothetical protein QTP88_007263 [Uroleucon formosanum]
MTAVSVYSLKTFIMYKLKFLTVISFSTITLYGGRYCRSSSVVPIRESQSKSERERVKERIASLLLPLYRTRYLLTAAAPRTQVLPTIIPPVLVRKREKMRGGFATENIVHGGTQVDREIEEIRICITTKKKKCYISSKSCINQSKTRFNVIPQSKKMYFFFSTFFMDHSIQKKKRFKRIN